MDIKADLVAIMAEVKEEMDQELMLLAMLMITLGGQEETGLLILDFIQGC